MQLLTKTRRSWIVKAAEGTRSVWIDRVQVLTNIFIFKFYPELNDVTLAGSHGKNSSIMLTSTPRRSINPCAFEPVLEGISPAHQEQRFFDDLEASMMVAPAMPAEKGGGKEALAHGGGGGSKLQKRLSLLVRHG
jgi:hypothetical protein